MSRRALRADTTMPDAALKAVSILGLAGARPRSSIGYVTRPSKPFTRQGSNASNKRPPHRLRSTPLERHGHSLLCGCGAVPGRVWETGGVTTGPGLLAGLPSGTVTLLFTDIESSSALWETDAPAMSAGLARHDVIVAEAIAAEAGIVFKHRVAEALRHDR